MLVDSPPYIATSPIFFPVRSQDPGPSSPQYPGPTSPDYFPGSSTHSPIDLSNLLEELFSFPDPLAGVEEFEPFADLVEPLDPPVDLVEPPVESEQVVEPSRKKRRRKWRIRYPQCFSVKRLYRRPFPEAPLYLERRQSDCLAATPRVDYGNMMW